MDAGALADTVSVGSGVAKSIGEMECDNLSTLPYPEP